jgi:hypothetical protein
MLPLLHYGSILDFMRIVPESKAFDWMFFFLESEASPGGTGVFRATLCDTVVEECYRFERGSRMLTSEE